MLTRSNHLLRRFNPRAHPTHMGLAHALHGKRARAGAGPLIGLLRRNDLNIPVSSTASAGAAPPPASSEQQAQPPRSAAGLALAWSGLLADGSVDDADAALSTVEDDEGSAGRGHKVPDLDGIPPDFCAPEHIVGKRSLLSSWKGCPLTLLGTRGGAGGCSCHASLSARSKPPGSATPMTCSPTATSRATPYVRRSGLPGYQPLRPRRWGLAARAVVLSAA